LCFLYLPYLGNKRLGVIYSNGKTYSFYCFTYEFKSYYAYHVSVEVYQWTTAIPWVAGGVRLNIMYRVAVAEGRDYSLLSYNNIQGSVLVGG
jgi:hypothetical protein